MGFMLNRIKIGNSITKVNIRFISKNFNFSGYILSRQLIAKIEK